MPTASSLNLIEPIVESYRTMLGKKAEYILSTTIPEQLDLLQDILRDPKIDAGYVFFYHLKNVMRRLAIRTRTKTGVSLLTRASSNEIAPYNMARFDYYSRASIRTPQFLCASLL